MSEVEPIIEIQDPEISVQELVGRLETRIRARQASGIEIGGEEESAAPGSAEFSSQNLGAELKKLRIYADSLWVKPVQNERHYRFLGSVLTRIEFVLQRLITRQVNMLAGRQIAFNSQATEIVYALMAKLEDQSARLEVAEKRLADLQSKRD